jgi:Carboxypeptidase regulatory-like domain
MKDQLHDKLKTTSLNTVRAILVPLIFLMTSSRVPASQVLDSGSEPDRMIGEVLAIDLPLGQLSLKTDSGETVIVKVSPQTSCLRVPPGEKRSGKAARISLQVIGIGDRVFANGQVAAAQQATGALRGQITDQLGAVIVGGMITVVNAKGAVRSAQSNGEGNYVVSDLPSGRYTVRASATGFAIYEKAGVEVAAGSRVTLDIELKATIGEQKVTVPERTPVNTEPDNNAGAIVLRGKDLDGLPDDPDQLADMLRALAGPSAGPNGVQFYVDGFTGGGRLPSRDMVREIRINQNPFSAEYDRLGFGRVEIITRPGTDKFHGIAGFSFSDESLNSRNPFALNRAPYQSRSYVGSFSGPLLAKRATFFIGASRRELDDNAVINATVLDPALRITPFSRAVVAPRRATDFDPRLDFQLNPKHMLSARYHYSRSGNENTGIGEFSLPSRAYRTSNTEHGVRLTENAILSARAVNETRFQFIRSRRRQEGDSATPALNVLESFFGGGSQIGRAFVAEDRWELHNYTTWSLGRHTVKAGGRLRGVHLTDSSPTNFGGTYTFAGGPAPQLDAANQVILGADGQLVMTTITSIERYRRTLFFQGQLRTPAEIRALGGGATQFTIAGGNPEVDATQVDFGGFLHYDWRLRPNFTLSLGLRYETQNNIGDHLDLAPRVAFAWSPWAGASGQPKTVIRGGFGIFYDRFSESFTLQARRYDGTNQQQFVVSDPSILDLFPNIPSTSQLAAFALPQTIRRVAADLRTPYTIQTAISLERQLPRNFTVSLSYLHARTLHLLRSRNINAPLPGSGLRPLGEAGNILVYESSGIFKGHQLIVNASQRLSTSLSLFAVYTLNRARSDTDGALSFPANSHDLRGEYGRSALDVRHRFFLGGSISVLGGISLTPLIVLRAGTPYNITIGRDVDGDTLFVERPAFAADLAKPGVVVTPFGAFDPNPLPGQGIIPRNFAEGPGFFSVNLGIRKRFAIGPLPRSGASPTQGNTAQPNRGARAERPYGLTFGVQVQNLFNHTNPGVPIGNLSSPLFGQSNGSALGGFSFGSGSPATSNRRIEAQVIFNF